MISKLEPSQKLRLIRRVAEDLPIKAFLKKSRKPKSSYRAFGMWKDRKDMRDSVAWVRKWREKEDNLSLYTKNARHFKILPGLETKKLYLECELC